jgi:hypothetical protein
MAVVPGSPLVVTDLERRASMAQVEPRRKDAYYVFLVATPDLSAESQAARKFFEDFNRSTAARWGVRFEVIDPDSYGTTGVGSPRDLIKGQTLERFRGSLALVIGLVGERFESLHGDEATITEESFDWALDSHRASGFPEIKIFFKKAEQFIAPNDRDLIRKALEQQEKIEAFERRVADGDPPVWTKSFGSINNFGDVFRSDLSQWLNNEARPWLSTQPSGNGPPPTATTAAVSTEPMGPELPLDDAEFRRLLGLYCRYMLQRLDDIDEEFNWSEDDLTPLEAEVEVARQGSRRPRLARDLVKAIQSDRKSRAFLVIGDPGSGKSVSLRSLARALFDEVSSGGPVPVYVNLREWDLADEPTEANLRSFLRDYLIRGAGEEGRAFLRRYYGQMLRQGQFFFILDSFDEMPSILDLDDQYPRHKEISKAFNSFLNDIHGCRGVLASRPFRQPAGVDARRITIRPFSEVQVRQAMRHWLRSSERDPDEVVRRLFRERPELAPGLRNPFMADLIARYLIKNPETLPRSYHDLFAHHFDERFRALEPHIRAAELTADRLTGTAIEIAWTLYRSEGVGLEIDLPALESLLPERARLRDELHELRRAHVVRLGGEAGQRVSFVHRRFAEYFAARALQREFVARPKLVSLDAIPSDSRWRDCFVVYCGIAPDDQVRTLAEYSWNVIRAHAEAIRDCDIAASRPAIHCLRFLRDTCQSRPGCLAAFRGELSTFVLEAVQSPDLLVAKLAAESLPLATPESRTQGIVSALERGVPTLSDTAIRSCRHLASLGQDAVEAIHFHTRSLPLSDLLATFRDLDFSLSLSDSLKGIRRGLRIDLASIAGNLLIYSNMLCIIVLSDQRNSRVFVWAGFILATELLVTLSVAYDWFGGAGAPAQPGDRSLRHFSLGRDSSDGDSSMRVELAGFSHFRRMLAGSLPVRLMRKYRLQPRTGFDTSLKVSSLLFLAGTIFVFLAIMVLAPFWVVFRLLFVPATVAPRGQGLFSKNVANSPLFIALLFLSICLSIPWNAWGPICNGKALKELLAGLRATDWKEFLVIIGGTAVVVAIVAAVAYFMGSVLKYLLYIIGILYSVAFIRMMIQPLAHVHRRRVDSLRLKSMVFEPEYDWPQVYHIARNFLTDRGQAQFFDILLARRATIHDTGTGSADFQPLGPRAAEQWALLREQVYGLRE